jgi:hypothetical protein
MKVLGWKLVIPMDQVDIIWPSLLLKK